MEIDQKLIDGLLEALLKISIVQTYEGRSTLIPQKAGHLNRHPGNDRTDLALVVRQLKDIIWEGEQQEWALLDFIDRAYSDVKGTTIGTELQALRKQCSGCWEKKKLESVLSSLPTPPMPPEPQPSSDPPIAPSSVFFEKASSNVVAAQNGMKAAFKPFKELSIGNAEPVECREATSHLTSVIMQLTELLELLNATSPLPDKTIAPYRRYFIEQIQYLTEQGQILIEWIGESHTTNKNIKEKFFILEKALHVFDILNQHEESD